MPYRQLPEVSTNELLEKIEALEAALVLSGSLHFGTKRISFGEQVVKWTVKGFTAEAAVVTGLTVVQSFVGTNVLGIATLDVTSIIGGTVSIRERALEETAVGFEMNVLWIAIGE